MCKNNNLFILNGRIGEDRINTKLTWKDKSTVNYFLSSAHLLCKYVDFQVNDFSNLFSDAHCGLSLCINLTTNDAEVQTKSK